MKKVKLFEDFLGMQAAMQNMSREEYTAYYLSEATRGKVYKAAKQGSYPAVLVVIQDGKVIHQEPVSTPEIAPATFNVMQEKYPKAILHLEDKTGKRLFSESVDVKEENDDNPCWDGYKIGDPKTKTSSRTGKRVNNCVPANESVVNEGKTSAVYTDPNTGKKYDLQYVSTKKRWELDIMKKGASIYSSAITTIKRDTLEEIQEWLDGYKIDSSWTKGLNESAINEDATTAFLVLMQSAMVMGQIALLGNKVSAGSDFTPIEDLKNWWKKRKSDKAVKSIIDKIKDDKDVVEFMKLTPSQQRGKFRSLIATKLNDEELEYLNRINRNHFQTESIKEGTYNNDREIAIYDGEDGLTYIEKRGKGYYGYNDEFDFEAENKAELEKKLKSWKYKLISGSIDEAFIGPFVFNDTMSDEELKAMYDGALDGYANWQKGFQHPKAKYKQAYQEIEKLLKKRGVKESLVTEAKFKAGDKWEWKTAKGIKVVKITNIKPNGDVVAREDGTSQDFIVRDADKFLKKKVNESIVNENATEKLADEEGFEILKATIDGKSAIVTATTTTKTWEDGIPVLKELARGRAKSTQVNINGEFTIAHDVARGWFYFTDGKTWFALHIENGYGEIEDLPFNIK